MHDACDDDMKALTEQRDGFRPRRKNVVSGDDGGIDTSESEEAPLLESNDDEKDDRDLPLSRVLASSLPLLALSAAACFKLGLRRLSDDVLVASIRSFVQLTLLGAILTPVFAAKEHSRLGTLSYVLLFMLPLAAYEATARSPLTYRGAYLAALAGLSSGVFTCLMFAIFFVVRSKPWYKPHVVIPLAGMLISNALSGTALALSELLNDLHNRSEKIDLLLAMGATPLEATSSTLSSVLSKALVPTLNSMNVIGLVSIPGMMTGQVLSGASPVRAARYQIMIMYLIAASTGLSAGVTLAVAIQNLFDARGVYQVNDIVANEAPGVSQLLSWAWLGQRTVTEETSGQKYSRVDLLSVGTLSPMEIRSEYCKASSNASTAPLLELNVSGTLALNRSFSALLTLRRGEITCLLGASGIGKSTFLRSLAELSSVGTVEGGLSTIRFLGIDRDKYSPTAWRKRILYVPQTRASALSGSPIELVRDVQHLRIRRTEAGRRVASGNMMEKTILKYLRDWGINDPLAAIKRKWTDLSGGEAQRVLLSIAFATEPDILLLDEPTSALDETSKGYVETSLRSLKQACAVVVVTHEEDQAVRLGATRWRAETIERSNSEGQC